MDYRAQERRFVSDGDEWRLQALRDSWYPIANCVYRELKGQPIIVGKGCRPSNLSELFDGLDRSPFWGDTGRRSVMSVASIDHGKRHLLG